jgi:hypothetical protein
MSTPERPAALLDRDPVAVTIEDYFYHEATLGRGRLSLREEGEGVVVSFAGTTVRAETLDIAWVRLARSFLDDGRFAEPLIERLRGLV